MINKEIFCSYLEETACELRAFPLTTEYLHDVEMSMREALKDFISTALEDARLKVI